MSAALNDATIETMDMEIFNFMLTRLRGDFSGRDFKYVFFYYKDYRLTLSVADSEDGPQTPASFAIIRKPEYPPLYIPYNIAIPVSAGTH